MAVPTYDEMYNGLLQAMRELGGSGSNSEIEELTELYEKLTHR